MRWCRIGCICRWATMAAPARSSSLAPTSGGRTAKRSRSRMRRPSSVRASCLTLSSRWRFLLGLATRWASRFGWRGPTSTFSAWFSWMTGRPGTFRSGSMCRWVHSQPRTFVRPFRRGLCPWVELVMGAKRVLANPELWASEGSEIVFILLSFDSWKNQEHLRGEFRWFKIIFHKMDNFRRSGGSKSRIMFQYFM